MMFPGSPSSALDKQETRLAKPNRVFMLSDLLFLLRGRVNSAQAEPTGSIDCVSPDPSAVVHDATATAGGPGAQSRHPARVCGDRDVSTSMSPDRGLAQPGEFVQGPEERGPASSPEACLRVSVAAVTTPSRVIRRRL